MVAGGLAVRVAILGAGIAGLTAAHELSKAGHTATVYEAAPQAGGLASGFRDERWEWPLERFYHHLFTTDTAIQGLVRDIGYGDRLVYRSQVTAQWWGDARDPCRAAWIRFGLARSAEICRCRLWPPPPYPS